MNHFDPVGLDAPGVSERPETAEGGGGGRALKETAAGETRVSRARIGRI